MVRVSVRALVRVRKKMRARVRVIISEIECVV